MSQAQEDIVEAVHSETPTVTDQKQEDTTEIEVIDAEQEAATVPKQEEKKPFDPKTDRVEFNTPEQQLKFDHMYKQVKMSDTRNQMLTDMLQQATKRIEEVENRFKNTDSANAERLLLTKIKSARDSGDDIAEINATKEMVEFLADKKFTEKVNLNPQPQQSQANSPEARYVQGLMEEVDASGNQVRPWLNENNPDFNTALSTLENIKGKYIGDPYALPKSLAELDSIMRSKMSQQPIVPPTNPRAPNPMQGGNLTNQKQKTTIKMTRQELDIAKKLGVDPKKYAARRDEIAGRK